MPKNPPRNELRIIGGRWRSRRLVFPPLPGIRPTPDRVRETLFNWLQHHVAGARCLDLFAGSGALGLEALSRGAAQCVFVDRQRAVARYLHETLQMLGAANAEVHTLNARRFLDEAPVIPFDIVFLDPPFDAGVLPQTCTRLEEHGWLSPEAHIYLEAPSRGGLPALPEGWAMARSQRAGAVGYHLVRRSLAPTGQVNTDPVQQNPAQTGEPA